LGDYSEIQWKMKSSNPKKREEAARKIGSTFSVLENKEQASKDLLALTKDPTCWHSQRTSTAMCDCVRRMRLVLCSSTYQTKSRHGKTCAGTHKGRAQQCAIVCGGCAWCCVPVPTR